MVKFPVCENFFIPFRNDQNGYYRYNQSECNANSELIAVGFNQGNIEGNPNSIIKETLSV